VYLTSKTFPLTLKYELDCPKSCTANARAMWTVCHICVYIPNPYEQQSNIWFGDEYMHLFNRAHTETEVHNIYWYNHQTQLIMYWNLLAGCFYKFNGTTCFGLSLTIIRSLRAKRCNMQLSYHSTQWDPIGFYVVRYNDSKNYKIWCELS